ncbi:hypothetical protein V8B97DRAFT_845403 [Scleroderma yunnanense]
MVLSLGRFAANEYMLQPLQSSNSAPDSPIGLPPKLNRVLSLKSMDSNADPAVESIATASRSLSTTFREATTMPSVEKPLPRPPKSLNNANIRTSLSSTSSRNPNQWEPASLFPINESFLPATKPPPPLKLLPKHKRSPSVLSEPEAGVRPRSAHGTSSAAKHSDLPPFFPSPSPQVFKRPTSSSGDRRPRTMYDTSDSPGRLPSSQRIIVSPESPGSPCSTASLGSSHQHFSTSNSKSTGTWMPPDSWAGPPASREISGKGLSGDNSKAKTTTGSKASSRFAVLSSSFWKTSFLGHVGEGGALGKHFLKRESSEQQGVVVVEGRDGIVEKAAVTDIIPHLRSLRDIRR